MHKSRVYWLLGMYLYKRKEKAMKVTLLLAQCTSELLKKSVQIVTSVLRELDVELSQVELHKLPYYEGKRTRQMDSIMASISESKGVIAISAVPMLGMHGAMQSFFDNATQYDMESFDKPMFAITYSEWLGEQEASQMMLKCWNILGGTEGGSIYMNKALPTTLILERLEKEVENFYRLIKQDRPNIGSSERVFYYNIKQGQANTTILKTSTNETRGVEPEIKSFAKLIKEDTFANRLVSHNEQFVRVEQPNHQETSKEVSSRRIDLSTKEQTIKEIAHLIEKEANGDEFKSMNTGIYTRPPQVFTTNSGMKRLQQIPHYFVAQYDREMHFVLKYNVTDIDEKGYIVIKDGDCNFVEETPELPTVEMILTEEVLMSILSKKMTYQKAFMLGKLKVKGNFSVLPKLDQVFKAL